MEVSKISRHSRVTSAAQVSRWFWTHNRAQAWVVRFLAQNALFLSNLHIMRLSKISRHLSDTLGQHARNWFWTRNRALLAGLVCVWRFLVNLSGFFWSTRSSPKVDHMGELSLEHVVTPGL